MKYETDNETSTRDKKGETVFSNHKLEFLRFFESHRRLCDVISGLKYHSIPTLSGGDKIIIKKTNFVMGIKTLNAFITDFSTYIEDETQLSEIRDKYNNLETKFLGDVYYKKFCENHDNLSLTQEINFTKKYYYYLFESFEIAHLMSMYLQKSLNISTREVVKTLQFVDYEGFFLNLSKYKQEVVNDIANLRYDNLLESFKKITGFFYTYRYLVSLRNQESILKILNIINKYIISIPTLKLILRLKDNEEVSESAKRIATKEFAVFRKGFSKVYNLCNMSLQMKNILPKTRRAILIDTTLI